MSEGTAKRRVGLAQGPGVQRARPGVLCSVAAPRCCNCLTKRRTKVALRLTERHYAIHGDLAYKLFTAAGFGGEFIRGGEAA